MELGYAPVIVEIFFLFVEHGIFLILLIPLICVRCISHWMGQPGTFDFISFLLAASSTGPGRGYLAFFGDPKSQRLMYKDEHI